ncbi:MAG: hypothetical protein Fues2KO_46790 [Fuerstiella sp.]
MFLQAYRWYQGISADISETVRWKEVLLDFTEPRLATSETLLGASIALLAGSWVLFIIQKEANARILSAWLERAMFLASSIALTFSSFSHIRYTDAVIESQIEALKSGHLLHPLDPLINVYFNAQMFGIVSGALCIGVVVISGLWIKK